MVPRNSPLLKNGLFVKRPLSNLVLRLLSLGFQSPQPPIPANPKKILLCNIANLGDVVISTTVLPLLKARFPDAEIGFLSSSASAVAVKDHPLVDRYHTFDHSYLYKCKAAIQNPKKEASSGTPWAKCKAAIQNPKEEASSGTQWAKCKAALHFKAVRRLRHELKDYDIAIDLYSYFPNAIPLLKKANIPIRVGYTTGGFGKRLTHPMVWDFADCYVGNAHLHLLTALNISVENVPCTPHYNYKKEEGDYIVLHMGSADPVKEWRQEKWMQLILSLRGHRILLTGQGEREGILCRNIARQTCAIDLSNQLSWQEFVTTIQQAKLLISVDSVPIHIAAGSQTPTIALFHEANPPAMWAPPGCKATPLTEACPLQLATYAADILHTRKKSLCGSTNTSA